MLKDSAYIHEKDAQWQSKKNARTGKPPVEPLYTIDDAEDALKLVRPVLYDQLIELAPEIRIVFNDAGHILGSAITELWITEGRKYFKDRIFRRPGSHQQTDTERPREDKKSRLCHNGDHIRQQAPSCQCHQHR